MRYLNLIYYLIHSDLIMSIQNGLVLSKPLTDNTPKIRSSKMGQLRKEIMPRFGNVYSKQWWGVKSRIIDIQPAPTKLELHACWSQSLIFFIGCRESQDADEQGVSFHPSNETRVVLTAGSPTAITHEKKGHIHGKTKPNLQTWVFPKIGGKNPKWMVKIMENPMNKWMIWGENPLFSETSIFGHMFQPLSLQGCDFSARKDHRIPARLCPEKFSPLWLQETHSDMTLRW